MRTTALLTRVVTLALEDSRVFSERLDQLVLHRLGVWSPTARYSTDRELETTGTCVDLLQKQTNLSKNELTKIITSVETIGFNAVGQMYKKNVPEGLEYSNVRSILEILGGIEGVQLGRLVRNSPFVLGSSRPVIDTFDENRERVLAMLGIEEKHLGKILSSNAYVLSRPADSSVKPTVDLLQSMGFSLEQVRSIVLRFPRILVLSIHKIETLKANIRQLGIEEEEFAKILWKFPPIVGLSASKLEQARQWLVKYGLDSVEDWRSVLVRFPQIASHNLEEKIEPIVHYMLNDLGLRRDVVKLTLRSAPDVFGRNLATIQLHVKALQNLGMTSIDISRYLTSYPGGLRINVAAEPYHSKLDFLEKQLGQKPSTVLPVHPRFLSYSMDRIASRAAYLQSKERSTNGVTGWCAAKDAIFATKFARSSLEDWLAFKLAWQQSNTILNHV
ncbi:hypothetical protein M9435_000075 [Picochlorum sp. BPE23]|nr:hypothetical protein M9435_000075 [Picochlorum sp. BPE23]